MSQLKSQIDMLLTGASSAYIPEGYICEEILPMIGAVQSSGKLAKYGNQHLRIENSVKSGRGAYRRVEAITRSTASYQIEGHGLEGLVSKEDYKNVLNPYDAEKDETMGLTSMLWLEKEQVLADTLTSTSIITQNATLAGSDQYSDYTNSDPLDDFATARSTVRSGCGMAPNLAAMDWAVWNMLRFHPQMLDALGFKMARPGGLSPDELAVALGVEKLLIGKAVKNSAKEGQSDSLAAVWGKHIVFAVAPAKAQPYQVSLGYRVQYQGEQPRKVYKYNPNNPPESTAILVEDNYDMLISNAAAAYLIKDAIA